MRKPLVRLVDDDKALTESFELLISTMGWDAMRYSSGREFLEKDDMTSPGCIVLDVRMPEMTGLEVQTELEKRGVSLPILFLSAHGSIPMAVHTMRHGAADFLEKPIDPMLFLQKVSQAVTDSMAQQHVTEEVKFNLSRFEQLTPREREVVELVIAGNQNKVIAHELGLEVSTVKMHRANAFSKLGVHSPSELIKLAYDTGFSKKSE